MSARAASGALSSGRNGFLKSLSFVAAVERQVSAAMQLGLILLLASHLLCVNVAAAGPLVCIWLEWKETRGDELAPWALRRLADSSLLALLAGGLLGLMVGALQWSPEYRAHLERLGPRLWYAVLELLFSLVLLVIYLVWLRRSPRPGPNARIARAALPLLAGTNLLYHFPLLFIVLSQVATTPSTGTEPLTSAAFRQLILTAPVMAQFVHFALAAVATVGALLMLLAAWLDRGNRRDEGQRLAIWGARLALVPSLLQIPTGVWILTQLTAAQQMRVLGGDPLSTTLMLASVILALVLLHQLSNLSSGEITRRALLMNVLLLVLIIVMMTGVLVQLEPRQMASASAAMPTWNIGVVAGL